MSTDATRLVAVLLRVAIVGSSTPKPPSEYMYDMIGLVFRPGNDLYVIIAEALVCVALANTSE